MISILAQIGSEEGVLSFFTLVVGYIVREFGGQYFGGGCDAQELEAHAAKLERDRAIAARVRAESALAAERKRYKTGQAVVLDRIEQLVARLTGKSDDALEPKLRDLSVALQKALDDLDIKVNAGAIAVAPAVTAILDSTRSTLEALRKQFPASPAPADSPPTAEAVRTMTAALEEIKKLLENA